MCSLVTPEQRNANYSQPDSSHQTTWHHVIWDESLNQHHLIYRIPNHIHGSPQLLWSLTREIKDDYFNVELPMLLYSRDLIISFFFPSVNIDDLILINHRHFYQHQSMSATFLLISLLIYTINNVCSVYITRDYTLPAIILTYNH